MGVRGAISQKAHYQILKNSHQIEAFTSPGNIKLADFTEMKITFLEGCVLCGGFGQRLYTIWMTKKPSRILT